MDKKQLKITSDGSHTLFIPDLDETYHSIHGAIQEAKHVFIHAGLNYGEKEEFNILEVGFGTGLNAFLSLLETKNTSIKINYTSLEAFPLSTHLIKQLNYTDQLGELEQDKNLYYKMHQVEWGGYQHIFSNFNLRKLETKLQDYSSLGNYYDIIYFDAFGPRVQPEMWTISVFKKIYNCLNKNGILVTYCAKGSVKRGLKEAGFKVESLPGPPGKREMTRAHKI